MKMPKTKKTPSCNVDDLLAKVEECMDKFEYETAIHFCRKAQNLEPDNIKVVETMASLMLECGDLDNAKPCLEKAIQLSPEKGYANYFSLGQLLIGQESVEMYRRGIAILQVELSSLPEEGKEDEKSHFRRALSDAYCSISETFMTDLCFEENAEQECVSSIGKAIEADADNPEAYQVKASYLVVREQFEEAKLVMKKSLSLWLPKMQALTSGTSETSDLCEVCPVSYLSRISASKLLIELEEYEPAMEVLEGLLQEDDQVVEVWYLCGLISHLRGTEFYGNARFYLNKAKMLSTKTTAFEPEVLEHVEEMLVDIGPGSEQESGDDDDDDDDDKNKENVAEDNSSVDDDSGSSNHDEAPMEM